jgi:transcriptional regulator with GAF, ATPase, and Fis domain
MSPELAIRFPLRRSDVPSIERVVPDAAIVGTSEALKSVKHRVELVAPTSATVLLLGETGTGKQLVARFIHQKSPRWQRNLVVVDCGALSSSLIESELFGRERGAYTGAFTSQPGRFEAAHGGTILLDEVGELPLELQPKLLRVLQEGQVDRLGGSQTVRVNVRIIAATNRNLADDVRRGRFRPDLFYRLNVFPITVPALRHRLDDLPVLVRHLSEKLGRQLRRPVQQLADGSLEALARHDWPGNIRELENVLQQAIILSTNGVLDLRNFIGERIDACEASLGSDDSPRPLVEVERDHMRYVLGRTDWRIEGPVGAARLLGVNPSTLRSKMAKLGIDRPPQATRASAL